MIDSRSELPLLLSGTHVGDLAGRRIGARRARGGPGAFGDGGAHARRAVGQPSAALADAIGRELIRSEEAGQPSGARARIACCDVVTCLAFVGERSAITRAGTLTLVHDWSWRRTGEGTSIAWWLLKRLNVVRPAPAQSEETR